MIVNRTGSKGIPSIRGQKGVWISMCQLSKGMSAKSKWNLWGCHRVTLRGHDTKQHLISLHLCWLTDWADHRPICIKQASIGQFCHCVAWQGETMLNFDTRMSTTRQKFMIHAEDDTGTIIDDWNFSWWHKEIDFHLNLSISPINVIWRDNNICVVRSIHST